MRNRTSLGLFNLLITILLLLPGPIEAQSCLPQGINFTSQAQIDAFSQNYPGCTDILGSITIDQVIDIVHLSGLEQIQRINGNLKIFFVPGLTSLNGLHNLQVVHGNIEIRFNSGILNLEGLSSLQSVGGRFWISNSSQLDFKGVESLVHIGGDLDIGNHTELQNLEGLNNLGSVNGNIFIYNNSSLKNVEALSALKNINGILDISLMDEIESLKGLENIDPHTITNLILSNCSSLSECSINNVCQYLLLPSAVHIIENNSLNCNSRNEIIENCTVSNTSEIEIPNSFYPNPTDGIVYVKALPNDHLTLFNSLGVCIKHWDNSPDVIDISTIPSGTYFLKILFRGKASTQMIIKH